MGDSGRRHGIAIDYDSVRCAESRSFQDVDGGCAEKQFQPIRGRWKFIKI